MELNRSASQNTTRGGVHCVCRFDLEEAQAIMLRYLGDRDREHVQLIYSTLRDRGHLTRESTVWNIFDYLSRDAITSLLTLIHAAHNKAKQHGRDVDEPEVKEWELYCWLGQTIYWGLSVYSAEYAFKSMHRNMSMRWGPTIMLQAKRFSFVNRYVQAIDLNDAGVRDGGVASLSQQWVDVAMRQSAKTFTATGSTATLDDEAIGSNAPQDVEVRGHSHEKRHQNHQPSDVVVVADVLRQLSFNSVVGYGLWKAWPDVRHNWNGIRPFLRSMTRSGIIADRLADLAQFLVYHGHLLYCGTLINSARATSAAEVVSSPVAAVPRSLLATSAAAAVVSPAVAGARGGGGDRGDHRVELRSAQQAKKVTRNRVAYLLKEGNQIRVTGSHLAKHAGKRSRCHWCHHIARRQQLCSTKCTQCDIYLCINKERQCFIDFHDHDPCTGAIEGEDTTNK